MIDLLKPVRDDARIFAFELDFAGDLHCIPMAVRLKLDLCGVKLSLRQWNRFIPDERREMLVMGCGTPAQAGAYRDRLVALIEIRAQDAPVLLEIEAHPAWGEVTQAPERLAAYAAERGVAAPSRAQWAALTPLQRFALFKLTRPGHDNDNFVPALREFGLA